mgnify:CR=1 FL=1
MLPEDCHSGCFIGCCRIICGEDGFFRRTESIYECVDVGDDVWRVLHKSVAFWVAEEELHINDSEADLLRFQRNLPIFRHQLLYPLHPFRVIKYSQDEPPDSSSDKSYQFILIILQNKS